MRPGHHPSFIDPTVAAATEQDEKMHMNGTSLPASSCRSLQDARAPKGRVENLATTSILTLMLMLKTVVE